MLCPLCPHELQTIRLCVCVLCVLCVFSRNGASWREDTIFGIFITYLLDSFVDECADTTSGIVRTGRQDSARNARTGHASRDLPSQHMKPTLLSSMQ